MDNVGDYLEFGVCHGTSLHCMHDTLKDLKLNKTKLFGFDSFEGLPVIDLIKDGWSSSGFVNSIEFTTKILSSKGINWERTFLIKGWFSETLTKNVIEKYGIKKASLIMIDCDLYYSAKEALIFCAPLIKDTAIIFFDDWEGNPEGEEKAFKEFLNEYSQLEALEFDNYEPQGKVFVVTNRGNVNNISYEQFK